MTPNSENAAIQPAGHRMTEPTILAKVLKFREGPIAMSDGSVLLVEIARGTLSRVRDGNVEVVAQLAGGPTGAAIGPEGHPLLRR